MEEVAEDNLNELVYRGMLQVTERNSFGRVKSCRMHDMMREVALQMSEREKFYSVQDDPEETLYTKARRLSIHKTPQAIEDSSDWISHLRSFLLFDGSFSSTASLFCKLSSGFKLLRILDLQGSPIDSVPEKVYHLFNLHYLSLKDTGIREISKSLAKLCNLETLDLRNTDVKELPHRITKLKKLRHLFVGRETLPFMDTYVFFGGMKPPKGLWDLKELQNLQTAEASDELVRRVRNLVKLRSFSIIKVRTLHCAELCISLSKMIRLHALGIAASEENREILELDTMSSPPQYLQKLFLSGRLKNGTLPHWFYSLRNLKELLLHWSRLTEDPIPHLHESLPSLASLKLIKVYEGSVICFRAGWFPQLKLLGLGNMPLRRIEIEEGALAKLEKLSLVYLPELKNVPLGIEHLTALQELNMIEMAPELVERFRMDGDTRGRVRCIPSIRHFHREDGQWFIDDLKIAS